MTHSPFRKYPFIETAFAEIGSRQSCMTPGTIVPGICSWPIRALVKPRPYATYKKGLADDPFSL
jgi:hypothetical protein